jgi:hypothetical protein
MAKHRPGLAKRRQTRQNYQQAKKTSAPGTGGRFKALAKSIRAGGKVRNPEAVAAWIGRKKYGAKQMAKWSAGGRKRGRK